MPSSRREFMEQLFQEALKKPTQQVHISDTLERPVTDPLGIPLVLANAGNPVVYVVKAFWSIDDGLRHNGVFDPQGDPADLPFAVSKATFDG